VNLFTIRAADLELLGERLTGVHVMVLHASADGPPCLALAARSSGGRGAPGLPYTQRTRNVDPLQAAPLNPHISPLLPLCIHEKHTRWRAARAAVLQPCARHPASRERRATGRPTRTAPRAQCPPLTYRARGVPTAIQRPTPRQREVSRHKARGTRSVPRGCPSHRRSARARDLAPASTGAVQPA